MWFKEQSHRDTDDNPDIIQHTPAYLHEDLLSGGEGGGGLGVGAVEQGRVIDLHDEDHGPGVRLASWTRGDPGVRDGARPRLFIGTVELQGV